VLREEREIRSRAQVLSTRQRLLELGYAGAQETHAKRKRPKSEAYHGHEREGVGKKVYYTYGKEGYLIRNCTEPSKTKKR